MVVGDEQVLPNLPNQEKEPSHNSRSFYVCSLHVVGRMLEDWG